MNSVNDLHKKAMEFADLGLKKRAHGNAKDSLVYFEQALHYELAAIDELDKTDGLAWAVLHRSAGTLALDCQQFRQAEQIVATALAQEPHPEIAEELRDLWDQIHFQRHLNLKGITLQEDEIQLSLSGQEVGNGLVKAEEMYERISSSAKLIYRTVERKQNRPFQERGSVQKGIRENYQTLISVPRSGSFAVTLKFGRPLQLSLPGMLETADIIDEFMELLRLINRSHIIEIQKRIPDPAYLRNFFGLARKIAPDGARISQVGFTTIRDGVQRSVGLTMPAAELPSPPTEFSSSPRVESQQTLTEPIEIRGILRHADAMREDSSVIQVIDGQKIHTVQVPQGMMNDIVRPMWDSHVIIQGVHTGERIILEDIWPDDSD